MKTFDGDEGVGLRSDGEGDEAVKHGNDAIRDAYTCRGGLFKMMSYVISLQSIKTSNNMWSGTRFLDALGTQVIGCVGVEYLDVKTGTVMQHVNVDRGIGITISRVFARLFDAELAKAVLLHQIAPEYKIPDSPSFPFNFTLSWIKDSLTQT